MMGLRVMESPPHPASTLTRECRPLPASGERLGNCSASVLANLAPLAGRGRIAVAIRVRGSLRKRSGNDFKHTTNITQNIVVPESEHPIMMRDQPLVAKAISQTVRMLTTIHFDDQMSFAANQVNNIGADGLLPNKFMPIQRPRTETMPQRIFGVSRIAPQPSGAGSFDFVGLAHVEAPLTRRFAPTSPHKRGEVSTMAAA
jgi:hypothetical protein